MKHRILFLAITSLLAAVGITLAILFAYMALGGGWHEPNVFIALSEFTASIGIVILGLVGWFHVVRWPRREG